MSATVETISNLERRLNMAVPVEEIEREVDVRLKKLSRTVKMAGFRPGKVPIKVVAQQYGGQVRSEVIDDSVRRIFGETIRNQNLRVAGYPKIEPKSEGVDPKQFEFSATFEVYPDIKPGDLSATTIERPVAAIGDAEVDKTLEILRKQRGTFEMAERAAANGDQVKVDFAGKIDGVAFDGGTAQGFPFNLGAGQMLPEFDAAVVGMKSGETKSFPLTFPKNYQSKDLAGKTSTFEVTVKEVLAPKLAEMDAEFAKSLGIDDGDLGKMRDGVKENVEREVKRRVQARLKEQVMKALQEVTTVTVPTALVELEVQRLIEGARADLESRGMKTGDVPIPPELFQEQARRRVTLGLILAEVVKLNNLQAKPDQIRALVDEQAASYDKPEDVIRWYYADPRRLGDLEAVVLEDNVVNWAMTQAKITEKAVAFDELMGNAA